MRQIWAREYVYCAFSLFFTHRNDFIVWYLVVLRRVVSVYCTSPSLILELSFFFHFLDFCRVVFVEKARHYCVCTNQPSILNAKVTMKNTKHAYEVVKGVLKQFILLRHYRKGYYATSKIFLHTLTLAHIRSRTYAYVEW